MSQFIGNETAVEGEVTNRLHVKPQFLFIVPYHRSVKSKFVRHKSMESLGSFGEPITSDKPDLSGNVSTDTFHDVDSKSKSLTGDFLKHEMNNGYFSTSIPNESPVNMNVEPILVESIPENRNNESKAVTLMGDTQSDVCPRPDPHQLANQSQSTVGLPHTNNNTEVQNMSEANKGADSLSTGNPNITSQESCSSAELPSADMNSAAEVSEKNEKKEPTEEWMDILGSGHLLKKVLRTGFPDTRPHKSDICLVSYTGRLEDGTVVENVSNLKIHLNDNEVIQGIDFALALMDKGEEAEIKVGPRFAYGTLGRKPDIPSGATLFYTITLQDVEEDPPINTLHANDRISMGSKKKERGNWWYSREEHSIAINCYRRALEYLDDTDIPEPQNSEDVQKLIEERLKTYNNLAASQMKIHAYDAALMSVNNVLTSQPNNVKALFRKAKILREKGEIEEAIRTVRQALAHDSDSQSLQQELSSLLATQRKYNSKQKELYKKMLGTNPSPGKNEDTKNRKSTYSAVKWTSMLAFAAVVVAGTVALKYKM